MLAIITEFLCRQSFHQSFVLSASQDCFTPIIWVNAHDFLGANMQLNANHSGEKFQRLIQNKWEEIYPNPKPLYWKEALSLESANKDFNQINTTTTEITPTLSSILEVTKLASLCEKLTLSTIIPGRKVMAYMIHNLFSIGTKVTALHGTNINDSIQEIDPKCLLEIKTHQVPSLNAINNISPKPAQTINR